MFVVHTRQRPKRWPNGCLGLKGTLYDTAAMPRGTERDKLFIALQRRHHISEIRLARHIEDLVDRVAPPCTRDARRFCGVEIDATAPTALLSDAMA